MAKLVDLCEEGSITNDETGWFMWRSFDNKWWNWLIFIKVRQQMTKLWCEGYDNKCSITNDETCWFM